MNSTEIVASEAARKLRIIIPPVLMSVGIPGNILSLAILHRLRLSQPSVFLQCLAIADLNILCVWTLIDWLGHMADIHHVNAYAILCRIQTFGYYSSFHISSWMQILVTVERTLSVIYPHKVRTLFSKQRSILFASITVAVLIGLNSHFLYDSSQQNDIGSADENDYCFMLYRGDQFYLFIWPWIDICVGFVIPCIVLLSGNIIIICRLRANSHPQDAIPRENYDINVATRIRKTRTSIITKRVILLNLFYTACIAPICVYQTGFICNWWLGNEVAATLMVMLMLVNSSTNFFLYLMLGSRFRNELLNMFRRYDCGKKRQSQESTTKF